MMYSISGTFAADVCVQMIQNATNATTGECKAFPTPCDVPTGWKAVDSCPASGSGLIVNGVNLGSCKNYSDGCNTCSIGADGVAACTLRYCIQAGTPKCLDTDTQLTDIEKAKQNAAAKTLSTDFKLKKFNSCDDMENVMKKFVKDYYNLYPYGGGFYRGGGIMPPLMMEDAVTSSPSPVGDKMSGVGQ